MEAIKNIAAMLLILFMVFGCTGQQLQHGVNAYNRGQYDVAARHWNSLAKNGNPYAQYNLGLLWEQGLGRTPKNKAEASNWFLLSAKQGYVPAMVRLAKIQKDSGHNNAALSWLNLAARWGNTDAVQALTDWHKPVPPPDLLHAKQRRDAIYQQKAAEAWGNAAYQIGRAIGGGGKGIPSSIQTSTFSRNPDYSDNRNRNAAGNIGNSGDSYTTHDAYGNIVNSKDSYTTRDAYGNIVNSRDNHKTRDAYGNIVDSEDSYITHDAYGNIVNKSK